MRAVASKGGKNETLAALAPIQPSLRRAAGFKTARTLKLNKGRRPRKHPEQDLQAALVKTLALILPREVFFFAVPNGGARSPLEAAIFVGQGVKPGVPDLIFIHKGRAFGLELKSAKGALSPRQRETHAALLTAGMPVGTAYSFAEALDVLKGFGLPLRIADLPKSPEAIATGKTTA